MRTYLPICLLIIPLIVAVAACSAPQKLQVAGTIADGSIASIVTEDVNRYRLRHGAKSLARHRGLDKLAAAHSRYMMDHRGSFTLYGRNVSHMGSDARWTIAKKVYNFTSMSENVASTPRIGSDQRTADIIVRLWEKSSDHDYAMRHNGWTHTGVGVVVADDGMVFATQLFAYGGEFHDHSRNRFDF